MVKIRNSNITRDISWLSFNARVLQEAADITVPLKDRIRFLGIFSNNLDEFFRVRVGALRRMVDIGVKAKMHLEDKPLLILQQIQMIVLDQQSEFQRIWNHILTDLRKQKIFLVTEKQLTKEQQNFVHTFFEEEVRPNVIPLMIEDISEWPYLRDKSIYLAVAMTRKDTAYKRKYALIEVPAKANGRFVILPSKHGEHRIILLEDVIRFCLPRIFSFFEYDDFKAHVIKVTRDAEYDLDEDLTIPYTQKILKGLKSRKKGRPVRFIYDKEIDPGLLEYLIRRMELGKRGNLIPGGRIHNFRHFMDFPESVFRASLQKNKPFTHPELISSSRVTDVVLKKDLLLHFPYHSFNAIIDLLREAAMDPEVAEIKITAYRLAENSKIINALINAHRNGKIVVVMLELRARFDEEANLGWKERLEDEGVKVLVGIPNMKVHAKLCVITRKRGAKTIHYGFVSTGNLHEKTAKIYGDHCLLTSDRNIMADISRIFQVLEKPKITSQTTIPGKTLLVTPVRMRKEIILLINKEIREAKAGRHAEMIIKINSLADELLIAKIEEAALAGVHVKLIVRGIMTFRSENPKFKYPVQAISIVDQYLEHARVWIFHNAGKERVFIASADWMIRNLDHRIETAVEIKNKELKSELKDILEIQLRDNVKARILDNKLHNHYSRNKERKVRSQIETYNYLVSKNPGIKKK